MFRILPPLPLCSMCRPASCERRNTAVRFTAISSSQNSVGYSDRKSTRLNSSHSQISYAVFCLKKKNNHCRLPLCPPPSVTQHLDDLLRAPNCDSRSTFDPNIPELHAAVAHFAQSDRHPESLLH